MGLVGFTFSLQSLVNVCRHSSQFVWHWYDTRISVGCSAPLLCRPAAPLFRRSAWIAVMREPDAAGLPNTWRLGRSYPPKRLSEWLPNRRSARNPSGRRTLRSVNPKFRLAVRRLLLRSLSSFTVLVRIKLTDCHAKAHGKAFSYW